MMLSELHIQNFAVIEDLQLKFGPFMTAISGEEGSGKSLVVDAISMLLGARAPLKIIRNGTSSARVEGIFWLSSTTMNLLNNTLKDSDIEIDSDGMIVISREIQQQGRSIARINSRVVPQSLLRNISQYLIDVHGQLDYISLLDCHHQLDLLDAHGKAVTFRDSVKSSIDNLRKKLQELDTVDSNKNDGRVELLKYQIDEIMRANPQMNEDENLQCKLDILRRAEAIKESCLNSYNNLYGDERSAAVLIHQALTMLRGINDTTSSIVQHRGELVSTITNLEEIARDLRQYSDKIDADSNQLEEIQQRLNLLNTLKRKYGATMDDILDFKNKALGDLESIENHLEYKINLKKAIAAIELEVGKCAEELSLQRRTAAQSLTKIVNDELKDVGLEWAKFDVNLQREESANGLPVSSGKRYNFSRSGIDNVEFMIATNPGEPLRPLRLIASGGETCRIMLALKSALRKVDPIPTLIFDEIDTGVGGRSGDSVGKKLSNLAQQHQVICVTHLPQIACFSDTHIKLSKKSVSGKAVTLVENIDGCGRVEELAAMLGSQHAGKVMVEGAEKLISHAQMWKKKEKQLIAS